MSSRRASRSVDRTDDAAAPAIRPIRVLLIEPHEGDAAQVRRMLMAAGSAYEVDHARSLDDGVERLKRRSFDVVLIDLDAVDGMTSPLESIRAAAPDAALIALSAEDGTSGVATVHRGAQDHLAKSELVTSALVRSMRYAVERQRLVSELRQRIREAEASAEAFGTIFRTTADAMVIVDAEGCVKLVNPAAERLFGRSAAELIGELFGFPIVAGDTAEIDVLRRDGERAVGELRVSSSEWAGEPAHLAAIRDITERRKVEKQKRELIREQAARAEAEAAERRARLLGEASRILLSSFDVRRTLQALAEVAVPLLGDCCIIDVVERDGRLQRVGVASGPAGDPDLAERLRAAEPDFTIDAGVSRVLRTHVPELIELMDDETRRAIAGEAAEVLDTAGYRGGLIVPLANSEAVGCMTFLYTEPRGRYRPVDVATAEDLARRALLAVENARLYDEAQKANKAKADFLAVMSQELRTPLNAIIGYSDLLLMGVPAAVPPAARQQVEKVRISGRHLLSLIEEILSYARMEAGRERVQIQPASLLELTREVVEMTEPLARARAVAFEVKVPDRDTRLSTDPAKIRQILLNLLSNAVKFTSEGEIRLVAEARDSWVEFTVTDTGIGIGPEHLPHIFEPFWQAESSRTRRAEGTGLGLSVARRFAHLLGGDITVTSRPGKGTTFSVRVPVRSAVVPAE